MNRKVTLLAAAAAVVLALGGLLATAVDAPTAPAEIEAAAITRPRPPVAAAGTSSSAIPPRPAAEEPERKPSPIKPGLPAYVTPLATQRPFVETPTSTPAPEVPAGARGAIPAPAKRSP